MVNVVVVVVPVVTDVGAPLMAMPLAYIAATMCNCSVEPCLFDRDAETR